MPKKRDRKRMGYHIKRLHDKGVRGPELIKQACAAVDGESPVQLARPVGDTDANALIRTANANPHEDTSWLVLADRLEELGHEHEAKRIRWWMDAKRAMNGGQKSLKPYNGDPVNHPIHRDAALPSWVARLATLELMQRRGVKGPKFDRIKRQVMRRSFGLDRPGENARLTEMRDRSITNDDGTNGDSRIEARAALADDIGYDRPPRGRQALQFASHNTTGVHSSELNTPLDNLHAHIYSNPPPAENQVTKLARHRDIRKHYDYWNFLNQIAENEEKGLPFDQNHAKVFADWLEEHGDARAHLARAAVHGGSPWMTWHASWAHPEVPGDYTHQPLSANLPPSIYGAEAYRENAHSRVQLLRQLDENAARDGVRHAGPVLHWEQHIPRTVSSRRGTPNGPPRLDGRGIPISRTAHLIAPVTVEQLHQFIDVMPKGPTQARWRSAAKQNGWHHPNPAPVKSPIEPPEITAMLGPKVRPHAKLARVTPQTQQAAGGAVRQSMSGSHDQRLSLAKQIMHEAGLAPATVRPAVAFSGKASRPSQVVAVKNSTSPQHAAYAAAWLGMLTGEPAMSVFHPEPGGKDYLHILDTPHPVDRVTNYLSKAGVPSFTAESRGPGTRVYMTGEDPWQLARGLDAKHSRIAGTHVRIGGSDTAADPRAASREAYRNHIRSVEAQASAGQDTGPAT